MLYVNFTVDDTSSLHIVSRVTDLVRWGRGVLEPRCVATAWSISIRDCTCNPNTSIVSSLSSTWLHGQLPIRSTRVGCTMWYDNVTYGRVISRGLVELSQFRPVLIC